MENKILIGVVLGLLILGIEMNPSLRLCVNLARDTSWDTTSLVSLSKASYVRYVLDKYNVTGKMLMNTETALVCGAFGEPPGSTGCESDDNSYFEQTKARYVPQAYPAGIKENLVINIWYTLLGWRNSNLLNKDLTPRPAYYAYQFASRQFLDATFVREITDYPGVRAYEFQNSQHRFWVVWSMDAGGHTINLPNTPGKVYDFLGNAHTPSISITITLDTLYIVW